jgi:two-component system LytT family sensor kinase
LVGLIYSRIISDLSENHAWRDMYPGALPLLFATGLFLYFTFSLIYYMVLALDRGRKAEHKVLENQLSASAAELSSLRASIHPHFLFNSLTSLSALTRKSPELAQKMCLQLADFLRYSLNYGKREWVEVKDELEHIEDYLGIEKTRLGERLDVTTTVDPDSEEAMLPPFTLLPLVENAVKHGFQPSLEPGTMAITIKKNPKTLVIEVKNPFEQGAAVKRDEGGHGLRDLQKRLLNTYSGEAELKISKDMGTFKATLRLPLLQSMGEGRG